MKPDDFGGVQRNVLGGPLGTCSEKPLTGFFVMVAATLQRKTLAATPYAWC